MVRAALLLSLLLAATPAGGAAPDLDRLLGEATWDVEQWTNADGLPVNTLTDVLQTRDGYLWIATTDGLVRFDGLRFDVFDTTRVAELAGNRFLDLCEDDEGALWIFDEVHYLIRYRDGIFERVSGPTEERAQETWYRLFPVPGEGCQLVRKPKGAPALVTGPEGPREGPPRSWFRDILGDVGIAAVAADRDGNFWVATGGQGLFALRKNRIRMLGVPEGLVRDNVRILHQDREGGVWIGQRHRLARVSGARVEVFDCLEDPDFLLAIYDDPGSGLLLGTSAGLRRFVEHVGGGGHCPPSSDALASDPTDGSSYDVGGREVAVKGVHRTRDGRLLVTTPWKGLFVSRPGDPVRGSWHFTRLSEAAGISPNLFLIHESPRGDVWLSAVDGGLVRLRRGESEASITVDRGAGLPSNEIRAVHSASKTEALWLATTDRGLARLSWRLPTEVGAETPEISVIDTRHGLFDNSLHRILEDERGWFWVSSNRGIFRVRQAELDAFLAGEKARVEVVGYTERDGMRNREANGGAQGAGIRVRTAAGDLSLWFPTQEGVAILDPAQLTENLPPPRVHVERVLVDERVIPIRDGKVILRPDERSFRVAYTAIALRAAERVRFRYRLEGYEDTWHEAGDQRAAQYTGVPPGSYRFRLQARSPDGVWGELATPPAIVVGPYFWETWWFRGLGVLALAGVLAAAFAQRERRQRARRRQLERQVAERTRELARERDKVAEQAEKLTELDRAKSELFANVSHEFRTPLTLSLGPLRDLVEGHFGELEPAVLVELERVRGHSGRLLALVNQLLDVARLDAGGLELRVSRGDLGRTVRRLGEHFVPLAERRGIEFSIRVPEEEIPAYFDRDQLDKVIVNLLSNAFKFTPRGGRVAIELEAARNGHLHLAVSDTGRGIAAQELARIFDRFFQAENAARRQIPGTGLGLALARDLVHLHGGELAAESVLGQGSTFTVRLPVGRAHFADSQVIEDEGVQSAIDPGESATFSSGFFVDEEVDEDVTVEEGTATADVTTVLVVDDHPDLRAYVRRHLADSYRVIEAADGAAGLEKARRFLPDLVVSDVMMPEMDGFELTRALKQDPELDFVPVVLLTARAEAEDKLSGLGLGADDYLTKPFDVRELLARVDNLIAQRRKLRERYLTEARQAEAQRFDPGVTAGAEGDENGFLERVIRVIDEGMVEEDFQIDALVRRLALSRTVFYERLGEVTDTSPARLIMERRMRRAAALLGDEANVSETAYAVGFKSLAHFSRRFRRHFGTTPSAFRRAA